MKRNVVFTLFLFAAILITAIPNWAGGASEGGASQTRGRYLAGRGVIIPPSDIHVESYISQIDYTYPDPETDLGINLYSGHRQLSTAGQEEIIQIGIQGRRLDFADLPPMNLCFVIDKSGSMAAQDKMGWVREAFYVFIERVRDKDYVALVVFDSDSRVLFPSTQISSQQKRTAFREAVEKIEPGGGTNLVAGLKLGYQQVLSNYRSEYTNRVLFLTDGVGESEGILEMAETYKQMEINVSTVGVGKDFDTNLMVDLARTGGGSSRFISDRNEMEKTFGTELDRMLVPVARDLDMRLEVPPDIEILQTWGYQNQIEGNTVRYTLATLHHRDYETILVRIRIPPNRIRIPPQRIRIPPNRLRIPPQRIRIPPQEIAEERELARFSLTFTNADGKPDQAGPFILKARMVTSNHPVTGFSNGKILRSGTMLHFAQSLLKIGELYYSSQEDIKKINSLAVHSSAGKLRSEVPANPEIQELEKRVTSSMKEAMSITNATKKELINTRLRLDNEGFDDEIDILNSYIRILGKELKLEQSETTRIVEDREIAPPVKERSLPDHLGNLFREITLNLQIEGERVLAISGFTSKKTETSQLISLLNEMAVVELAKIDTLKLVEREKLLDVLREQELALSDLMDTSKAITVGKFLSAGLILTGTVIEMSGSVIIFGRVIDVETAEIQSAAQVIVDKNADVNSLL